MKKIFLILLLFLLPLQYTWAMVAGYDTHDAQDTEIHFGHHEHDSVDNHTDNTDLIGDNESDSQTQTTKIHEHFGFLHISSGEVLSHDLPIFVAEAKQPAFQYLFTYHSPPNYQPERPNWLAAV